jgi:hypothetical protein
MTIQRCRTVIAAAMGFSILTGCAGANLGALGDVLGGVLGGGAGQQQQQQQQLVVEVQGVNAQQQTIQVRTQEGQTGAVLFDQNTVVVYRQQQYPVTALERGDVATMQVQQIDQNRVYASRIDVQQSVQDRGGQSGVGQLTRISGRVGQIDRQRGLFELQAQQGTFTVVLPANAGAANTEYFQRLRSGQNVGVEGTIVGTGRLDLYRFI